MHFARLYSRLAGAAIYANNPLRRIFMNYREALLSDIPGMSAVRLSVRENRLSSPSLVTEHEYADHLTSKGKGWVAENEHGVIVGIAIVDLQSHSVWAMFVHPDFEGKGIGKTLHRMMLDFYFAKTDQPLYLGTDANTRAERFYRLQGWREVGLYANGEVKFEMSTEQLAVSSQQLAVSDA